jgi:hypothetical protein
MTHTVALAQGEVRATLKHNNRSSRRGSTSNGETKPFFGRRQNDLCRANQGQPPQRPACTGPVTEENEKVTPNVRHGLTAETVIDALEDAEDYAAFEMAVRLTMMRNQPLKGNWF